MQEGSIFLLSEEQFTPNSANNTFFSEYFLIAFYLLPLPSPSTGWWRAYAPLLVGVSPAGVTELVQDLELWCSSREKTVARDLCIRSAASEVGFSGMETWVNSGSEGDSWWGHLSEVPLETSSCPRWRFTFVHSDAFLSVFFHFFFLFCGLILKRGTSESSLN